MDNADRAQRDLEILERARRYKRDAQKKKVISTGYCLFCGEPLEAGRRWCDADCRDDWQKESDRLHKH